MVPNPGNPEGPEIKKYGDIIWLPGSIYIVSVIVTVIATYTLEYY